MFNKNPDQILKNPFLKIGVILYFIFAAFLIKSTYFSNYTVTFKSPLIETAALEKLGNKIKPQAIQKKNNIIKVNTDQVDTINTFKEPFTISKKTGNKKDSLKRILLIGDSQLENLRFWVRKSLLDNGYKLSADRNIIKHI